VALIHAEQQAHQQQQQTQLAPLGQEKSTQEKVSDWTGLGTFGENLCLVVSFAN